ncbi:hypothetical protein CK203_055522 [Vitis vinifera]|uniref:Reverse transcriptase domain-containing protein n=1 Tax=Vitis vinifera TaxID=29760 RepID=A0A438FKT9_VITVI|nr:hypothetical protein CK203_055522 [Vitis vinifera]
MSRSINVPVVGLFDLFGEMTVEGVVETNPSIPKVTPPLRAQPMDLSIIFLMMYLFFHLWIMPQSPDSNSNTVFGHSRYKVEPTDEDSKIIDLDVEVYVNNMIVKSQGRVDHLTTLERFFEIIRQFKLRLNPKKCTFKVTFGKLGYMSIRGSIVTDHLASLSISDDREINDDFLDDEVVAMASLSSWRIYFDGVANHSGYG